MSIRGKIFSAAVLVILFSPSSMAAQEVLNGSYICEGFVDQFQDTGIVSIEAELSATSGITSDLSPTGRNLRGLPANLDALFDFCNEHITQVLPMIPSICAVGPPYPGGNLPPEFGIGVKFDFSCKADRNRIINAISELSRIPLAVDMP